MRLVPLAVVLFVALVLTVGCGSDATGGGPTTTAASSGPASLAGAGPATAAAKTARFTLTVAGIVAGVNVHAQENGSLSFTAPRAHIYKLVLGGGIPQELVIDGPITYTNGNVEAAMNDSTIKPWTKLDTRRLSAKQRLAEAGELAHVRAAAYLVFGVADVRRVGTGANGTTHFRGTVDPARLARRLPASVRASIVAAVAADYVTKPFPADFWVDEQDRVRRVHVSYATKGGGHIDVDAGYSGFGAPVDLTVPPARDIKDITP